LSLDPNRDLFPPNPRHFQDFNFRHVDTPVFGMEVGHDHKMTPFDFEVIRSKVEVTGAMNKKSLSSCKDPKGLELRYFA
jgi:hypothetical protein